MADRIWYQTPARRDTLRTFLSSFLHNRKWEIVFPENFLAGFMFWTIKTNFLKQMGTECGPNIATNQDEVRHSRHCVQQTWKRIVWPMSWALTAIGRCNCVTNLLASDLISMTLFISAKSGARGKAATKIVTNPNWIPVHTKNLLDEKCPILTH